MLQIGSGGRWLIFRGMFLVVLWINIAVYSKIDSQESKIIFLFFKKNKFKCQCQLLNFVKMLDVDGNINKILISINISKKNINKKFIKIFKLTNKHFTFLKK